MIGAQTVTLLREGADILDENLISKKELLAEYGISYGALYRWKRKGLIPDEWFIRRSTATGQETFFKRDAICERFDGIIRLRDSGVPLDEMSGYFEPENEHDARLLVIDGKYGRREFLISEITEISLSDKNGESRDITNTIREMKL